MACDVFARRQRYAEMSSNPLRKQNVVQAGDLNDLLTEDEA